MSASGSAANTSRQTSGGAGVVIANLGARSDISEAQDAHGIPQPSRDALELLERIALPRAPPGQRQRLVLLVCPAVDGLHEQVEEDRHQATAAVAFDLEPGSLRPVDAPACRPAQTAP